MKKQMPKKGKPGAPGPAVAEIWPRVGGAGLATSRDLCDDMSFGGREDVGRH
jgi:hypothetical protein